MMPLVPLFFVLAPWGVSSSAPADDHRVWIGASVELGEQTDELLVHAIRKDAITTMKQRGWRVDPDAERRINVLVVGEEAERQALTYTLVRPGQEPLQLRQSECTRCGSDQVVALVRRDLTELVRTLDTIAPVAAPASVPSPTVSQRENTAARPTTEPRARALGRMGRAGVGTLVVGAIAAATGVGFVAVGKVEKVRSDNELAVDRVDYRIPGAILLGVGAAAVITGVALLCVDQRRARHRRAGAQGWFGHGGGGVSLRVAW